jgi:hypothetical protein
MSQQNVPTGIERRKKSGIMGSSTRRVRAVRIFACFGPASWKGGLFDPWKGGEAMTLYEALNLALSTGIYLGLLGLIVVLVKNTKK